MLTSCGSSAAHVTCCVGDLCVDSGDMVTIFATRARCSAIGVVVISARVCVSARVLVRDEGGVDVSAAVARERLEGSLRGRRRDRRSGAWTRRASSQWDDPALLRVTKVSEFPRARSGNDRVANASGEI